MVRNARRLNIVMSGGGVKGIAFVGVFDVLKKRGFLPVNLAGVSSGAIAVALAGAGYNAEGMWDTLEDLPLDLIKMNALEKDVPAVRYIASFAKQSKLQPEEVVKRFLNQYSNRFSYYRRDKPDEKRGIIQSVISLCKEGCLFDGDLLEEWISGALLKKGIKKFADLRGGRPDESNPSGYKVRMTGVDCNRLKIVTFPDDVAFYGFDPDEFEVAKAIRISTSVPFAFKPVVLVKKEANTTVQYNFVDGGVLDSFPVWLIGNGGMPSAGFRLRHSESKPVNLSTPLSIFKNLVATVHKIGLPAESSTKLTYTGEINTGDITFLDMDLSADQKQQLFESGRRAALDMFI